MMNALCFYLTFTPMRYYRFNKSLRAHMYVEFVSGAIHCAVSRFQEVRTHYSDLWSDLDIKPMYGRV